MIQNEGVASTLVRVTGLGLYEPQILQIVRLYQDMKNR